MSLYIKAILEQELLDLRSARGEPHVTLVGQEYSAPLFLQASDSKLIFHLRFLLISERAKTRSRSRRSSEGEYAVIKVR